MRSHRFSQHRDLARVMDLIASLGTPSNLVDFNEKVQIASICKTMRVLEVGREVVAIAYLDNYNNLWFDVLPGCPQQETVESACIAWGVTCMQALNAGTGKQHTMDSSCTAGDSRRIALLKQNQFTELEESSLTYLCPLERIVLYPLPPGFSIRPAAGKAEVEDLVSLHRQAFGTQHMTVEERLAIMNTPEYFPELDLLAVAPDGNLAAFCICGFDDPEHQRGYTDPIGTHPRHQRKGLARALTSFGMWELKRRGARSIRLGTSSRNQGMQALAEALGFTCVEKKLWFEREV